MALPWIQVDTSLPDKAVVMHVKRACNCSANEAIGLIVRVLCWADGITADGVCRGFRPEDVDERFGASFLAVGLLNAGWIYQNEEGWVVFSKWGEEHNGDSTKKRNQNTKRVSKHRERKRAEAKCNAECNADVTHEALQDETICSAECNADVTAERNEMRYQERERKYIYITPQPPQGAIEVNYDSPENFVTHGGGEVKPPEQAADDTPLPYPEHFEAFWKDYPKRTGMNGAYAKAKIQRLWRKAIENGYTGDDILRALDTAMQDKMWVESNYQRAPRIVNWFENEVMYSFLPRNRKTAVKRAQSASRPSDEEEYPELSADDLNTYCE